MNEPAGAETIQSDKDALANGTGEAELWLKKIRRAQDDEKQWREDAKIAVSAYEADDEKAISFNIFHSNIETMIPALYNSSPVPDVRRRFGDADHIGKQVADLTERALSYCLDQYDIDGEMISMLRDALVCGRGVMRLRYTPHQTQDGGEEGYQELTGERVPWDKFIRGPGRSWAKIPWCAVEHDLTKDELRKINPKLADKSTLGERADHEKDKANSKDPSGILKTTRVYEVWDKPSRTVLFVDDQKQVWSKSPDMLGLPQFMPFLQPLQPVHRPTSLVPVCQYKVYKPLLDELDSVTKRISKLVRQLKVRGLIDGEMAPDFELLKNCDDGQYVAASNAAQFASQGGLEKGIAHWPLDPIVKALQQLYVQRDSIKQTIYEVTGISDILRGASDPHETLGAQEIKKQMGSLRIQRLQGEVARVARELFRAKVDVIAKHFLDQNIMLITGMPVKEAIAPQPQQMPQQGQPGQQMMPQAPQMSEAEQQWPQVLQTFRSEIRSYRIDIETDSTIRADMSRDQEQMNGFLAGTGQFAQAMAEIIQIPTIGQASMPVMVEVYTAFARKFKLGKQAEDALDKLSSTTQQMAQQPPEEKPNPEVEKAQAQIGMLKEKHAADMASAQGKMQMEGQALQAKMQSDERLAQLAEQKAQMELAIKSAELQMKREEMAMNLQAKQAEHEMKAQGLALDQQAQAQEHEHARQDRVESFAMDQAEREAGMETMTMTHDLKRQGMADKAKFDRKKMQNGARTNS